MKEEQNKSGKGLAVALVVLCAVFIIFFIIKFHDEEPIDSKPISDSIISSKNSVESIEETDAQEMSTEEETLPEIDFYESELYSEFICLIDSEGNLLYEKNGDETMPPASLTKIMTVLVALDNIQNIDDTIQIPGYIYDYIASENASTAGFEAYDTVTFRDLMYGAILGSGAECCLTLSDYIAGSDYDYAQLMNEKAEEIGLSDTHFANSTGLHASDHYSTASDIAMLLRYALDNYEFRSIFTRESYYTETEYNPYGITLESTMFPLLDDNYGTFEIIGGKTGYTDEAGLCLASLAEINEEEYILVTAGAEGTHYTDPYHIEDAETIYSRVAESLGLEAYNDNYNSDEIQDNIDY